MNNAHTPGPWHVGGNGTVVYASDGWAVTVTTMVHVRDNTLELAKANAALIAAAPDLLAALGQALMALSGYTHQNQITTSATAAGWIAINKAKVTL